MDRRTQRELPGASEFAAADHRGWLPDGVYLVENEKGKLLPNLINTVRILAHHPAWDGVIAFDQFSGRTLKVKAPPTGQGLGEWSDTDDTELVLWLSENFGVEPAIDKVIMRAVQVTAERNAFHEVRDYLEGLKWDGIPRVDCWLAAYLGAPDSPYSTLAGRKWMLACVARIFQPGCKADNVLILEGEQGGGKSTALKVLGGEWFTDAPFRLGDREGWMVIRGKWIVELGELDSFNRAESTAAKQFFSQYLDRFRTPWGKRPIDVPRQCCFAGTTNQSIYLKDESGNRRYWPVRCGYIDLAELRADRDQLWAEAVHLYREGVPWHVQTDERDLFSAQAEERLVPDAYETKIYRWLENDRTITCITVADILQNGLQLDPGKWTRAEQTRVGQVMSRTDWMRVRSTFGSRDWYYVRPVRERAIDSKGMEVERVNEKDTRACFDEFQKRQRMEGRAA